MARTNATNIYTDDSKATKDLLAERYDALIQGIQREAISSQIKNTNLSGDPRAGSVEVSRFANSTAKAYGTARAAGKGDALINSGKVTVNINVDREIVEEVEQKDLRLTLILPSSQKPKLLRPWYPPPGSPPQPKSWTRSSKR